MYIHICHFPCLLLFFLLVASNGAKKLGRWKSISIVKDKKETVIFT